MTLANMWTTRKLFLALAVGCALWVARTWAQTRAPQAARPGGNVQFPHYTDTPNGRVLADIFTGSNAIYLPDGAVQVKGFKMIGLRDGQISNVTVTALAPECRIDDKQKTVGDPGPIQIFTPDTNLFVQGIGFFLAESNQVLLLSNQVETRVVRAMLRSSPLFAPAPNASPDASQIVKILSERGQFDFRSNLVDYSGRVQVLDPQYQLDAPLLTIQLASNQTVETMFARPSVTLTLPGKGAATGATAHYFATNENPLLELAGDAGADAHWQNGEQEATATRFTYDPNRHLLTGAGSVRVRWPNTPAAVSAPHTFLELFADVSALQMSPDGAEVEGMTAAGNVILANQADQSSALAGKAVYDRSHDLLTLTEDPVWWNDRMEVRGDTLSMASSNKVYHAQGNARLKLRMSGAAGAPANSTNQWLYVSADDLLSEPVNSQTNLVTFRGDVRARLLDGEQLQDTLSARVLFVYLSSVGPGPGNQVVLMVAREDVRAETAPDAAGVTKTLSCGVLTAHRSAATGLWQNIVAEEDAVLTSFGAGSAAVSNVLTADTVTAHFSSLTNQLENAVAEGGVAFAQTAPGKSLHATGDRAVYTAAPEEQVELTGHPWAQTDQFTILDADRLRYDMKSDKVDASGRYHIVFPKSVAASGAPPAPPSP
jgi:lipopolysaccharide export system protein LptA